MSKISELAEATTLSDADMAVIDNTTDGSRKFKLKRLKDASDGNATDIGKLQDSMADEYDVNVSYSAGDYAMYEGTLYKATDTTTGAWDSSKWSEAQISDDVRVLNSNFVGKGTHTINVFGCYGFVSGGAKAIYLFIPVNIAGDVTSISSITALKIGLRTSGSGGYAGGADNLDVLSNVVQKEVQKLHGYIMVRLDSTNAWTNCVNNSVVCGTANITFTLA